MKAFPVNNLESNYYFTKQAFLDEEYVLLSPETPITTTMINRLKRWRYRKIFSNGTLVDTPTVSTRSPANTGTLSIDQDIKEQELLQEAHAFYMELVTFVERMFTSYVTRDELAERSINDIVKRTIDMVQSHRGQMLRIPDFPENQKNYIVNHAALTTIVAVAVGLVLKVPKFKLIELGTAAMVHEIGMIRLPPQLYMSNKQLSPEERKAITASPVLGFRILKQFSFPMSICLAVLECRENLDGSGYPRGLTGEKISLYAKVITVAASYAAMVSKRPFRKASSGHNALMEMLKQKGRMYDDAVLRALVLDLSIYPIGSCVELASGQRGMVVESNKTNVRAPSVRLVAGPGGEFYAEQQVVDTSLSAQHAVVRALPEDQCRSAGK
jgi:HD-GYP domain-containing protein (c-di-GMP phosphodiesterase class II)